MVTRLKLAAAGLAVACVAGLAGCNGDDTVVVSVNSPNGSGGVVTTRSSELTLKQGQKLLADIKKDPKRLNKLTPPEKRFISRAFAAKQIQDLEEESGR